MANISKPLNQGFPAPSIVKNYGPYESIHAAHVALGPEQADILSVGLTVGIIGPNNTIIEYWYQGGIEEINLVPKKPDLSGIEGDIQTLEDTVGSIEESLSDVTDDVDDLKAASLEHGNAINTINNTLPNKANTSDVNAALNLKANTADVATALAGKQDVLTFDNTPTNGSTNPVTSGGVKAAIDDVETVIEDCAYLGADDGQGVIADFDPQSDTLWKKTQVLSNAEKATVKNNLGITQDLEQMNQRLNAQDAAVAQLDGHALVIVDTLPTDASPAETPDPDVIYRKYVDDGQGDVSYEDYMYNADDLTTPIKIATYALPGVDEAPTAGSSNLVKSGGVFNNINSLRTDNLTIKDGNTDIPPVLIGYTLYSTGEPITNIYLTNYGVTDFIPVGVNDTVKIVSGVMQAASTNYPYIAFYNASKEKISVKSVATAGEITNTEETVPEGAVYFRLTTANNAPAVIDYKGEIAKAIEDLQGDVEDLQNTVDASLSGLQEDVDECRDLLGLNGSIKVKCATGFEGYLLKTDGTTITSAYTTTFGVSDYIPVTAGDSFVLSGAYCGSTGYAYICFYSSASESGFVSEKHTTQGAVNNVNVTVPNDATYMRIVLNDKTVPATLDYGIEPVNVVELKEEVDDGFESLSDTKLFFDLSRQMYNPPLPIKDVNDELNILLIGSSYGVDTITALVDICKNVGLKVVTGDMYKSGGTTAQYLDDLANNRTNTIYYNYYNKDSVTYLRKVDAAVKARPWDVIIVQDSSVRLATKTGGYDKNFVKWISVLREMCTNPRVVFAFNATWVHADSMDKQTIAYQETYKLMQQSGIDIAIPSGAAIEYLRQTSVNDGNNIYRDALHLDTGVGRFTAACSLFFAIVNYVYGVGLDECTLTGKWDVQGSPVSTNPTIEVTDANRDTCIACAKRAITNRFMLPTE